MKIKSLLITLLICLFVVSGCTSTTVNQKKISLPEDIPNFVTEKDIQKIDWDRTAAFDTGTRNDMVWKQK